MKRKIALILVFVLAFALMSGFTFEEIPSGDLFAPEIIDKENVSAWALEEYLQAEAAGIVTEHTANYKKEATTRFQFAELVVNMVELTLEVEIAPAADDTFTDCAEEAVLKAYAAGIVNGMGDGTFAPDATTTREQIAAMVYRAIRYINEMGGPNLAPKAGSLAGFADKDKVSAWAVEGVGALAANGIMNGISATELAPKNSCTVEQSILLVFRVYKGAIA